MADPRRVLIAVEQAGEKLQIYGLIDIGLFIESVLLYTAEMKHGGTLPFVPEEITHEDSRLLSRATWN